MRKKKGKEKWMAIKLDMEKAYDRLEWSFILNVLRNFGFNERWINWISECISITFFSILINGSPYGFFQPQRDLRQGDPLSPFLFIIAAEVLSKLLQKAEESKKLKGIKLAKGCQPISHLQFADDLFIFGRADEENIRSIKECLSTFSSWSGQKINTHKSTMVFSKNLSSWHSKNLLAGSMGLKIEGSKGKYLGLPMLIGKSKKGTFQEVVERVEKKYQGWKVKLLS